VSCDSNQKPTEERRQDKGQERDGDGGEDGPEEEGVPLPEPETAREVDGMFAGGVEEFVG